MSAHLFVYGTLQPAHAPAGLAHVVSKLRPIGEGFVNGILYDLGEYPGAVLNPDSKHRIAGTVFRLPDDPSVLRTLDAYEEFDPDEPGASLFLRVAYPVALESGGTLECWIYVYNRDPGSAPIFPDGKFQ
jgi:gamma-glutamylcyclotransferase (GGCT)/AIG2-like uncharacterized protein YtfP